MQEPVSWLPSFVPRSKELSFIVLKVTNLNFPHLALEMIIMWREHSIQCLRSLIRRQSTCPFPLITLDAVSKEPCTATPLSTANRKPCMDQHLLGAEKPKCFSRTVDFLCFHDTWMPSDELWELYVDWSLFKSLSCDLHRSLMVLLIQDQQLLMTLEFGSHRPNVNR